MTSSWDMSSQHDPETAPPPPANGSRLLFRWLALVALVVLGLLWLSRPAAPPSGPAAPTDGAWYRCTMPVCNDPGSADPNSRCPVCGMKRELVSFPVMGFELYIDHEVEDGEDVYYEHLTKCPFLDMARKMGISEIPCDFICSYDVELALRDKRGRWEVISRMGDGDPECQFRIRDWVDE